MVWRNLKNKKMKSPLLTIIIASYNSGKTIREALQSVKDQTFQDWECLVVDGASKDNTIEIVKEFESLDSRFKHISEPDNGIYDAFNKGWRAANGEWIYYLGSDDRLMKNGLFDLISKSNNADVVFGKLKILYPNGTSIIKEQPYPSLKPCRIPVHQSLITKRECIKLNGGFDEHYKVIADKDLSFQIYRGNRKFVKSDTIVAAFTVGGTSSNIVKIYKENFYFCHKHELGIFYIIDISIVCAKRYLSIIFHRMTRN